MVTSNRSQLGFLAQGTRKPAVAWLEGGRCRLPSPPHAAQPQRNPSSWPLCLPNSSLSTIRYPQQHPQHRLNVTCAALEDVQPVETALASQAAVVRHWASALHRFTRPHTMLGTLVSVVSVSLLAVGSQGMTPVAVTALAQSLSSALLMNICIVGINQIYDIEIDRINKPYLPLAAGDFTPSTGAAIVSVCGAISLAIGAASGSLPLLCTLAGSLLLGLAYSADLPFLRWKKYPVLAAACILAVRSILVQLGFFFHMQLALGAPTPLLTRPVLFATAFMFFFSIVIALFKDIPDVSGDKRAGVRTLSVRVGQQRVFWACIALLEVAYMGAIGVSLCSQVAWSRALGAAAHLAIGALVWWRAKRTDLTSSSSIYDCYMDVWKAFYAEYLILPVLR